MSRKQASTVRITKTRTGTRVRATGSAAQALFDAMCKAHGLDNPVKTETEDESAKTDPVADATKASGSAA